MNRTSAVPEEITQDVYRVYAYGLTTGDYGPVRRLIAFVDELLAAKGFPPCGPEVWAPFLYDHETRPPTVH